MLFKYFNNLFGLIKRVVEYNAMNKNIKIILIPIFILP